jgi:RimJ/RimL family protein N-acetyltransferase
MGEAPVLQTDRLRLRPFRADDLGPHAATMVDPRVVRYIGGSPLSREDAWRRLVAGRGMWAMLGYGYWAVERRSDGAWLGQVGFADFKRDMDPSIEGLPEMGWIFAPDAQGQGYASEAVAAGIAWADRELKAPEVVAIIDPDNAPSIRVAERGGFDERSDASYRGERILLFRRARKAR